MSPASSLLQEAESRSLSSQLEPVHYPASPAQSFPMVPRTGYCSPSEQSQQSDGQTYQTPKHVTLPSHISPSCPPMPPYHLLGFGSFTAESSGLPSGQVLGEMAVEHPEASGVHLAYGHFRLVPWSESKGYGGSASKHLLPLSLPVTARQHWSPYFSSPSTKFHRDPQSG